MRKHWFVISLAVLSLVAAACGGDDDGDSGSTAKAIADAETDAEADSDEDTETDAGAGAEADGDGDGDEDAEPDTETDAEADPGSGSDGGRDDDSEPGSGDGAVAELEALGERYWVTTFELNNPPQPEAAGWDEIATPALAEGLRGLSASRFDIGTSIAYVGPADELIAGVVVDVRTEASATVELCLRDETIEYDLETDETVAEFFVFSHKTMEAINDGTGWLMSAVSTVANYGPDELDLCLDALGGGTGA